MKPADSKKRERLAKQIFIERPHFGYKKKKKKKNVPAYMIHGLLLSGCEKQPRESSAEKQPRTEEEYC